VDINRSIQKLPSEGQEEFLHWDFNPFAPSGPALMGLSAGGNVVNSVAGKVCYTKSRFVCVPGTHTEDFHKRFNEAYRGIYKSVKESATKFNIIQNREDPFDLKSKRKIIRISGGCMVMWNPLLLHGQTKTPKSSPTEYGTYLGYFTAGSRKKYETISGVGEKQDRIDSYTLGRAPKLWPSLDRIHYYPKRFQNFPKILISYIRKLPKDHPIISSRITKNGKTLPHLIPIPNPEYCPPPLTELGKLLLGLHEWPSRHTCFYNNSHTDQKNEQLSEQGFKDMRVLFVKRANCGPDVNVDAEIYKAGFTEHKANVHVFEIPRKLRQKSGKGPDHRDWERNLTLAIEKADAVIGFETLGDKYAWSRYKAVRRIRPLSLVLIPNLGKTKLEAGWSRETTKNLLLVNVIVAKTCSSFRRLHKLFLLRRFTHGAGNLILVPHTTMLELPKLEIEGKGQRKSIIHFAGASKSKNTFANCRAAAKLISKRNNLFEKLIIICRHVAPKSRKRKLSPSSDESCKTCKFDKFRRLHPMIKTEFWKGHIEEAHKARLYKECRMAMCASKREDFGHHILEAAAHGCQVITTDGMPMKSILRWQVGLAKPDEARTRNLGASFRVKSSAIVAAGERLISNVEYDPKKCQLNVKRQIDDFRTHFLHLMKILVGRTTRMKCDTHSHLAPSPLQSEVCPGCPGRRCSVKLVSECHGKQEKLEYVCSECGETA